MALECRLPLLRSDFDPTHRAGYGFLVATHVGVPLVVIFLLVQLSHEHAVALGLGGLALSLLVLKPLLRKLLLDHSGAKDFRGWITLRPDALLTEQNGTTQTLALHAGMSIHLENHYIQGRPRGSKDHLRNGIATLRITNDGTSSTHLFLVRDRTEWNALRAVVAEWYRKKLEITEKADDLTNPVFLLDANWSYTELQRKKAELGVG